MNDSFVMIYEFFIIEEGQLQLNGNAIRCKTKDTNEGFFGYSWALEYYGNNRLAYEGWYQTVRGLSWK